MTWSPCGAGAAALLLAAALAACSPAPQAPLQHDAYVWQRHWNAPVASALRDSADIVRAWHILAAEVDAGGRLQRIGVDLAAVAASGRPAIPVVRVEAAVATLDARAIADEIARLRQSWQASDIPVIGVEIDHDCGSRQLAAYGRFLETLRPALAGNQTLSITLLPDWLDDPDFGKLLPAVDETVLQLHSLRNPSGQLFDPAGAQAWTSALARRTDKRFRVALPDYGSRVLADDRGRIAAVESEMPIDRPRDEGREMFAAPPIVAAFLHRQEKNRPHGLAGIAWFRLPVAGDLRAWTRSTWRAVITGRELPIRLETELEGNGSARTLLLINSGEMDTDLPAALVVDPRCRGIGSASSNFILEQRGPESVFLRSRNRLFRAGSRLAVGRLHCPNGMGTVHIEK